MKKRYVAATALAAFTGLVAYGGSIAHTSLKDCNTGDLDACSEVAKLHQDKITNKQWLDNKAKSDAYKAQLVADRKAKLAKLEAEEQARKEKLAEENRQAEAKFKSEGWFQLQPGIYGRWCTQTCSRAEVIGSAAYWLMEVWCKDRACGDIYAQLNIERNGTVVGWTNDTAYLGYGQKGILTFQKYGLGNGSAYQGSIVKFNARG